MKKTKLATKILALTILSLTSCSQEITRDEIEIQATKVQKNEVSTTASRSSNSKIEQNIFELIDKTINISDQINTLIPNAINESLTSEIYNSTSENELRNLLSSYGVENTEALINLLKEQAILNKQFHDVNVNFYQSYTQEEREAIITKAFDNYFFEENTTSSKLSCYDTYLRDLKRANRNYVTCLAGAWATAVFSEGVGGLIVAAGCVTIKHFQDQDAVEDYQNCIHP